jgi:hypothetical protein
VSLATAQASGISWTSLCRVSTQPWSSAMEIKLRWKWYDLWIGAYWSRASRTLYVCPLPTVVLILHFPRRAR